MRWDYPPLEINIVFLGFYYYYYFIIIVINIIIIIIIIMAWIIMKHTAWGECWVMYCLTF